MAHPQQLQFVKSITTSLTGNFQSKKGRFQVLEVGAYDVNGSIRQFFPNADYLGVDLIEGPGVDLICEGDKIPHEDNIYDISISCECFEHNPSWAETFKNMYRMTKNGGIVVFTCATTGRAEHGTTRTSPESSPGTQALRWDYYKNLTEKDFSKTFNLNNLFGGHFFLVNHTSCDLYFFGIKGQESPSFSIDIHRLKELCLLDQESLQTEIKNRRNREKFIPKPLRKITRKLFSFDNVANPRLIDNF
jgi:SAM-dependent methyltransferase